MAKREVRMLTKLFMYLFIYFFGGRGRGEGEFARSINTEKKERGQYPTELG